MVHETGGKTLHCSLYLH